MEWTRNRANDNYGEQTMGEQTQANPIPSDIGQCVLLIILIDRSMRPDPAFTFKVCFWNWGLLPMSALSWPGLCSGSAFADPKWTQKADLGFGWGLILLGCVWLVLYIKRKAINWLMHKCQIIWFNIFKVKEKRVLCHFHRLELF